MNNNDTHQAKTLYEPSIVQSCIWTLFAGMSLLISFDSVASIPPSFGPNARLPTLQLNLDTVRTRIPQIGGGTYFNGVTEVALGHSEKRLRGVGYGVDLDWWSDEELWDTMDSLESLAAGSYNITGSVAPSIEGSLDSLYEEDDWREEESWGPPSNIGFSLQLRSLNLDGDSKAIIPIGGSNVANTYFSPNPNGGSTGIFLGPLGQNVDIDTEYDELLLRLGYLMRRGSGLSYFQGGPRFVFQTSKQQHDVRVTSPSFPSLSDFSSRASYDVDEYRVGLGYSLHGDYRLTEKLSFGLGGGLDLVYRNAELKAKQNNLCWVCPATENSVSFSEKRDDSGTAVDLDLKAGLAYNFSERGRIGLTLGYEYSSGIGEVETKDNPNERLKLGSDYSDSWQLGLTYKYSF